MKVYLVEYHERGYQGRTRFNASNADLTIAFTVDATTAGERLTRKAATEAKYGHIDLNTASPTCAARAIHYLVQSKVVGRPCEILNIAGNGLQTLSRHGWTQGQVNQYLYEVFVELRDKWGLLPTKGLRSGGQTGVDIAAAVMADTIGIDAVITFPTGFLQRGADGRDFTQTKEDVRQKIAVMTTLLARQFINKPLR